MMMSANNTDDNGYPFLKASDGSLDFGKITDEHGIPPAPIRLSVGNEHYGKTHIENRHGKQIRGNGFQSVEEFVQFVCRNFDCIKEGNPGSYLLEVHDRHSNTLFISLSNDQGYWKTISGGVFNLRYSKNKKKIYSASDQQTSQPASDDEGLGSDD